MSNPLDLTGRTAFVTGSTRGIGRAIAGALHAAGARVAIVGRTLDVTEGIEKAEQVAAELGEDRVKGFVCDLGQADSIREAVTQCETSLGPIDILVNNAGLTRDNLLIRMTESEWDEVLDTNLKGAFLATQAVIKGMMKRRQGRIINITSVIGITGNKGQANYAASKAGLIGLTKSVAKEYAGRGVLVNCIAPGFIRTVMTDALPEATRVALLESIPLGRLGSPEDIAGVVLFLASELGGYITGQTIVVDGGMIG